MPKLFESLGTGTYVALRELVGEPLPDEKIRRVRASEPTHTFDECDEPWQCESRSHRREHERNLAKQRKQRLARINEIRSADPDPTRAALRRLAKDIGTTADVVIAYSKRANR